MFSVVIPLYNKELSVRNTINSVLDQTFKEFEVIIVNDGSTDNSLEIVQQFKDDRIRIIDKPNGGVSSARNRGIKEANYEWIAFLDADDLWEDNHLEVVLKMMKKFPEKNIYATSFEYSDGRKINRIESSEIYIVENYFKSVLEEYLIWTGVIVVHRLALSRVGLFNIKLSRGEDLDLWARLAKNYDIVKSRIITAQYRVEAENRSDLSFNLNKSRVFHYDFNTATTEDEIIYYK